MVGRIGGDEFVVLSSSGLLIDVIDEAVRHPLEIDGHDIRVSASIGLSQYPQDGETLVDLMRLADQAMYRQKQSKVSLFNRAA